MLTFTDEINRNHQGRKMIDGEVEIIARDKNGNLLYHTPGSQNAVKIMAKEIISHRVQHSKIWDKINNEWTTSTIDPDEDYSLKYIMLGASFDSSYLPLSSDDDRYYETSPITGKKVAKSVDVGATNYGGLINPVLISEPTRPLKRIERIYYEPSYQPAGSPLLNADVRALNNILVLETVLELDEYNGFGTTSSDYFTLTEVALAAGKEIGSTGACECDPHDLFLEGSGGDAIVATANGTSTINIDVSETVDTIKEGDQIKIVESGSTADSDNILNQLNPYYLVVSKAIGGVSVTLDRTPVDSDGNALSGQIGVFKDTLRIFSHKILSAPYIKNDNIELTIRWRLLFS